MFRAVNMNCLVPLYKASRW